MGRKTKVVVVPEPPAGEEDRDAGKRFLVTEMPPLRAEKWANRALLALVQGGAEIPDEIAKAGMAGIARMGLQALSGLRWETVEPLLDELLTCVQFMPNLQDDRVVRPLRDEAGDLEEVSTIYLLRAEAFKLHVGFLRAGVFRSSRSAPAAKSPT